MKSISQDENVFYISKAELQSEAIQRIGRNLSDEEIHVAKKGLEFGLQTGLNIVYDTIFTEMLKR